MPGLEIACCSFCHRQPADRLRLVRAPGVSICADCVRVALEVLEQRGRPEPAPEPRSAVPDWAPPGLRALPPPLGLAGDLVAQPGAAAELEELRARARAGAPVAGPVLLLGPSGTGKSRALGLIADALAARPTLRVDLADGSVDSLLDRLEAAPARGLVLLDALERAAASPALAAATSRLLSGCGKSGGPALAFAALTTGEGDEGDATACGEATGALVSLLVARAAGRGVPPSLLACFSTFVAFEALGAEALERLLASRIDVLVPAAGPDGARVRIEPGAAHVLVDRALRLGGGAWGLKAVLAAAVSGLGPERRGAPPGTTPARPRALKAKEAR